MDRRRFLKAGAALGAAAGLGSAADPVSLAGDGPVVLPGRRADHDFVLRGGTVVDGTGAPGREADVAVAAGRIAAVGSDVGRGAEEIDVRGLVVAPGFIDIHSHADLELLVEPRAESRIRQGVTLEVAGQDGGSVGPWSDAAYRETRERYRSSYGVEIDFRDPPGFLRRLARTPPVVNVATMVGHGAVRSFVMGREDRPARPGEVERMRDVVLDALRGGAVGLSSGLEYTPGSFADTDELVAVAEALRGTGLPYASHMRNEDDRLLAAVEEALHVGRRARVPVQISHLKAQGRRNWWKAEAVLHAIEEARAAGVDVHFDRYPYVAYATGLTNLFPAEARAGSSEAFLERLTDPERGPALERAAREKVALLGSWDAVQITRPGSEAHAWVRGRRLGEAAAERGIDPYELVLRLLVDGQGSVGMIGFGMSEENTARFLSHPLGMICSDGGSFAPYGPLSRSSPHPRAYGSFPRVLGHYVRERGDLTLEAAVHKMSGLPARKLGLPDRGVIRPGAAADLVAFDPQVVADRATFTDPHRYPDGIPLVLVNGAVTLREGEQTGARAGGPVFGPAAEDGAP